MVDLIRNLSLLFVIAACDSTPKPAASERTEPPAKQTIAPSAKPEPDNATQLAAEHALTGALADLLPAGVEVVVATSSPRQLVSALGMPEPAPENTIIGKRLPAFEDLHPARLAVYGLDPDRPAGIFKSKGRFGEVDPWGVFAHVDDVQLTTWHLRAREEPAVDGDAEHIKRYRLAPGAMRLIIAGDLAIVTYRMPSEGPDLGSHEVFGRLSEALDFGGLVTAYVAAETPVLIGLGNTPRGITARAVSSSPERAQAATQRWFEYLYDVELGTRTDYPLEVLERTVTRQLESNTKLRELHVKLTQVDERIAELEDLPTQRKSAHTEQAFERLDGQDKGGVTTGLLHVHTRIFEAPEHFVNKLADEVNHVGLTNDEQSELTRLKKRQQALRRQLVRELGGLPLFGETKSVNLKELLHGFDHLPSRDRK